MPDYVPTIAEIEKAMKYLHDPEMLRTSRLTTLKIVHYRVDHARRVHDYSTLPLPWIYGYELASLLRERIDYLLHAEDSSAENPATNQRSSSRVQLYAHILKLRFVESRSWSEVAEIVGLAAGHIQNKLKRPAFQRLLSDILEQNALLNQRDKNIGLHQPHKRLTHLTNLPQKGEFIGRRNEVEQLLAKLQRRRMPILEISGIGGVGKSALAKHVGWRALEEGLFDAVIWMSAKQDHLVLPNLQRKTYDDALSSLNDLFETIIQVLNKGHLPANLDARRLVLDLLNSEQFPNGVLIIVDNYETLHPQEQQRIASFLLEDLPYPSQALITSRHEELLATISSLVLPIKIHLERMLAEDAAACLDYFLSLHIPPIVTDPNVKQQIIALADQIPLAMLWLLGQLRASPYSQTRTLAELKQRRGSPDDILSYIFDYSYTMLNDQPDVQFVLHALSAFDKPIPFEPLIASTSLPVPVVQQALLQLQQLSLLVREDGDEPRYDLVALARSYLQQRVPLEERNELLKRAATYYAKHGWYTDRPNILPLLEWALEQEEFALSLALFDVLTVSHFSVSDTQGRDSATYGPAIVQAARALQQEQKADWYEIFTVCWVQVIRGQFSEAQSALLRLLERAQQQNWQENIALACSTLGLLFIRLGETASQSGHDAIAQFETAASYLRRAAVLWEDSQRSNWLAIVMGRLGNVAHQLGDYERALDYYAWSEALYISLGDKAGLATMLGRRGHTLTQRYKARNQGDPQEIERLLQEALRLSEQTANRWIIAANSLYYAEFLELKNEPSRAQSYAEHASQLFGMQIDQSRAQQATQLLKRLRSRQQIHAS